MPRDEKQLIRLSGPDVTELEVNAVAEVLRSDRLSLGPKQLEFEQALADYTGCRYGVAVNSGTSALHLIVQALGIGEGNEVITTPFSFIASSNCLLYVGATPVFVDIDPKTSNLDCDLVEKAITPRSRAILAVDAFGYPADWARLRALARKHGLHLIEDSCEALGSRYRFPDGAWAKAGSLGDVGTFAFYPNKQITTGEGGMIVTDSEAVAGSCRALRNQGRDVGSDWQRPTRLGYNYRLSELNCALGLAQMQRIEELKARRQQVADWYQELLAEVEGLRPPQAGDGVEVSWFVYVVRLTALRTREELVRVVELMRHEGVQCSNYFYPIHLQQVYRERFGFKEGDFPVTEGVSRQSLAVPFFNRLTKEEVERVVDGLRRCLAQVVGERAAAAPRQAAAPSLTLGGS